MSTYTNQLLVVGTTPVSFDVERIRPRPGQLPQRAYCSRVVGANVRCAITKVPEGYETQYAYAGSSIEIKSPQSIIDFKAVSMSPTEQAYLYFEFSTDLY